MSKLILALDQGTTSSRAILFDRAGTVRGQAQREHRQIFPQPGWVEHDPIEIWQSQIGVARQVMSEANASAADIAAIGITNQRETVVVWDRRTGIPIHNAIVWQDRRTAEFCDQLRRDGHTQMIQQKTGLVIDAYFSASKVRWLLDHIPGARDRADRGELAMGTIDSWLLWNLTGGAVHATDVTNASRTMLFNIHARDWDPELLDLLQVPRSLLPMVHASSAKYAMTDCLGGQIPITGMAGDQQAALFGQTCFDRGLAKNTYGTGCFLLMNTGDQPIESKNQLLSTVACEAAAPPSDLHTSPGQNPGDRSVTCAIRSPTPSLPTGAVTDVRDAKQFALEGSIFIGGAVVQWLRDGLGVVKTAGEIETLAASVGDCGGVYMVPAFAGLGAPHWDQYARGTITGITRGTTAAHFARAALESIAFQVADVLDVMQQDSGIDIAELRVDGGAAANDLLLQFQADLLRVPVVRPKVTQTTGMGAAFLAGLAVGFWKDLDEIRQIWQVDRTFTPAMDEKLAAHRRRRWSEALQRSRDWEEHESLIAKPE
jgi:glycerol kinase